MSRERNNLTRRDFLSHSVKGGLVAVGAGAVTTKRVWATTTQANKNNDGAPAIQITEEGIAFHPVPESQIMRGFPPNDDNQVTVWNYSSTPERARYANMRLHEIYPVHYVPRGNGPVCVLPRSSKIDPLEFERIPFTTLAGNRTTVREHLEKYVTNAFLVLKKGIILYEGYWADMKPETLHACFSARKSVSATAIATMVEDGSLDIDAPVERYVPELNESGYRGVKLRDALDMASGIRFSWSLDSDSDIGRMSVANKATPVPAMIENKNVVIGQRQFLATLQRQFDPGSTIAYRESDASVLVWAAERAAGMRFADLLSMRIWSKLGAEHNALVPVDAYGFPTYTMAASLRDFGRWGQMCLQEGLYNGMQIVPKRFFADLQDNPNVEKYARSLKLSNGFGKGSPWVIEAPQHTGYRSLFWIPGGHEGAILASGHLGQYCYVAPKYDTVIVKFGSFSGAHDGSQWEDWHALREISRQLL
jgi:CubicO group peptidase (beta-lactamase class C family)